MYKPSVSLTKATTITSHGPSHTVPVLGNFRYLVKHGQELRVIVVAGGAAVLVEEQRAALVRVLFVVQQPWEGEIGRLVTGLTR